MAILRKVLIERGMNEIRIYHSVWKRVLDIVLDGALVALGVSALKSGIKPAALCWFLIICFGLLGLFTLYMLVRDLIRKEPYLVITEESVTLNEGKKRVIRFADVESFRLAGLLLSKMIAVKFLNERAQDAVMVMDTTMKPKAILNLLNERLAAAKKA